MVNKVVFIYKSLQPYYVLHHAGGRTSYEVVCVNNGVRRECQTDNDILSYQL